MANPDPAQRLLSRCISSKQVEEVFAHGVVMAVFAPAHAGEIVITQEVRPVMPCALALPQFDGTVTGSLSRRRRKSITSASSTKQY